MSKHSTSIERDCMDEMWLCLACRWKGRLGAVLAKDKLRCPECNSDDLHPTDRWATGEFRAVDFLQAEEPGPPSATGKARAAKARRAR